MSRPGLLLLFLILSAFVAGGVLVRVHERNTAKPAIEKISIGDPSDETAENSPPSPPVAAPAQPTLTQAEGSGAALEGALLNEAYQISKARSLQYQDALEFQPCTPTAIQKAWQKQINMRFPSDTLERLGLALQTLGILPADEDLVARYRLRPNFSPEALYDPLEGRLLHSPNLSIEAGESKEWSTTHLALMLLDQNFAWHESQLPVEVNLDRALAQRAFAQGDATLITLKHTQADVATSQAWKRTDSLTNNWPPALREIEFLPLREAIHFCQSVTAQDVALDAVYQRLPTSTAHLIHPDRYLEIPPWEPRRLQWAQLDLRGSEPVWENVVGELLIRAWLQRSLTPEDAGMLASGWEGDGVLLYQTPDQAPQLVWKTNWRRPETAMRFFDALVQHAKPLFEITGEPTEKTETSAFFDDLLSLKLMRDDDTVTVLRGTEAEWTETLQDLAQRSSFEASTGP